MTREQSIEALREWIRDPNYWISNSSPSGLHRQYLEDIWGEAMRLSGGDPSEALTVATEAVKSGQQPGESEGQYHARLNGLPSRAFGGGTPFNGEDKLQHFFRSAAIAYVAGESTSQAGGIFWEALDWLGGVFKSTGGFDEGDIWADNLGAAFGAALRWNPDQSIHKFLQTAPGPEDAVVLRLGIPYIDGGYVAEMIIPSPEGLKNGELIELRCVDGKGYAYVMSVAFDPNDSTVQYGRLDGSSYRLARNDPWYVPPAHPRYDDDVLRRQNMSVPSQQEFEVDRRAQSGEMLRNRLQIDLQELQAQQQVVAQRMARQMSDQEFQRAMRRDQDVRERIEQTHQRINSTNQALDQLQREQGAIQQERLREFARVHAETHNSIAQQGRAEHFQRLQEEQQERSREQQRRENERRTREQLDRDHHQQQQELHRQLREQTHERHPIRFEPPITGPQFPNV